MLVSEGLRDDLVGVDEAPPGRPADAVVLGDLGTGSRMTSTPGSTRSSSARASTGADAVRASGIEPTATIDSFADLPGLLGVSA
jgi:hypothetical protein